MLFPAKLLACTGKTKSKKGEITITAGSIQ